MWDLILLDASAATMIPGTGTAYGEIRDAAIAVSGDRIAWVGPRTQLPGQPQTLARRVVELGGDWVTPGLVDCHTHLVWGGSRIEEFEARLSGVPYAEIAQAGGGILATVRATREAGEDRLAHDALGRLDALRAEGVTTVEIKSGYGLDTATELKMLRVARRLASERPVTVRTTFLGAHAVPPEHSGDSDAYVDLVCHEMLPAVAESGLADAVDAFCETIAFSPAQVTRVLIRAIELGLPVKLHAEQLSDQGGAALAANLGALSADHLEYLSADGVAAMAAGGTVAVLLPGAFYVLRETQRPPVEEMRRRGVPMAVSTDCNPGSSPVTSPLLMLSMACTFFGLTPAEALGGMTREAARALGLESSRGTLERGKRADLAVWSIERPAELSYAVGANPCRAVIRGGTTAVGSL